MNATHPTAENSAASSYSVKDISFLCNAIASARPPIPAPVVVVSWVTYACDIVGRHADDSDVETATRLCLHIDMVDVLINVLSCERRLTD